MALSVKSKILLTVLSVVVMFTFFILFYFPARQEQVLIENYNEEIENFANSVSLGVKIALTEQNFEGVETAIDFVRDDRRLEFVSIIQIDTLSGSTGDSSAVQKTVFRTFPEGAEVDVDATSNESFIYKTSSFDTPIMTGEVMLGFSTEEIIESMEQIRFTSIMASLIVFGIGLSIGYLLARNISEPVLALRDAAKKVGEGDLSQSVSSKSRDEIGELAVAFNKMVRELKIEAALEKIRNQTISMQHSGEWGKVVDEFFVQMRNLGFDTIGYRIIIRDANTKEWHYWVAGSEANSPTLYFVSEDRVFQQLHSSASKENQFFRTGELPADADGSYSNYVVDEHGSEAGAIAEHKYPIVISTAFTDYGALEAYGESALSLANQNLLQRLATVIDQSFTRYLDLKKSEKQALEAVKQASLDRMRGEIASMRSKEDLNEITPLVWRELTSLQVPFVRCGVFIMDEEDESIICFLSTPDAKALGSFTMNVGDTKITSNIYYSWIQKNVYTEYWNEEGFTQWTKKLIELGHIKSQPDYQGGAKPPQSLHLHFVPFKQGMLYVGNVESLSDEHIVLVKSLAKVFSIAFARYEDFNKLEKAKDDLEDTILELKETQDQLVQQEKLASLGQLTAGIAHEIKNPLNFVNNFSDLSIELIEEVRQEIKDLRPKNKSPFEGGGDLSTDKSPGDVSHVDEALEILNDIEMNLKKIYEHGSRADGIVKSMLEHSRGGSGKMEPTEVNGLVKEFVNLSFHGMRASKNPINVDIDFQLDDSVGEVPLIVEDFSRVIVNLCNNAFDAMREKVSKDLQGFENLGGLDSYSPKLTVRTKAENGKMTIEIEDNGPGIPAEMKDKILQQFFTTKKGTEGTGLGLSITNDIIKAHGGQLKIKTEEESGSVFVVSLPGV